METVINDDTATDMVDLFFDYYDLDIERRDETSANALRMCRSDLITAVMKGRVEMVEEDDEMVVNQFLKRPIRDKRGGNDIDKIRYGELTGKAKKAGGKFAATDIDSRGFALLSVLSGQPSQIFDRLRGPDVGVAGTLANVFLML